MGMLPRRALPYPTDGFEPCFLVFFSPDGRHLAVGCTDGTTRLWDVAARREVARWGMAPESTGGIVELAVSPDGRLLATLADAMENNLLLRDFPKGTFRAAWTLDRQRYHPRHWLRLIAFSPDSRTLAASEREGVLKFHDVAGGPTVRLASGPKPEVMALAFHPKGRWLATSGEGDWIKLWPWEELLATARRQGRMPARKRTARR
jgi:WD40 repeat protein